jgi:CrcB protein
MKTLVNCLAVGGAGFLGAILRWFVASVCGRFFGTGFPVGTLVINISGCLFLGWFMTFVGPRLIVSDPTKLAVATGFVGAYTTFSTFIFESNGLLKGGAYYQAILNLLGSLVLGLLAVQAGIWLAGR